MTPQSNNLHDIQTVLAAEMVDPLRPVTPDTFMSLVGRHVRQWNTVFHVPVGQAGLVEAGVLQNSFPAFLWFERRDPGRASQWVVHTWRDYAEELEQLPAVEDPQSMLDYDRAVFDFLSSGPPRADQRSEGASDGKRILGRLMTSLGLSQDETGRMFGVTGETIRRWERGKVRIPHSRMAGLVSAEAALERLEGLFVADRLPPVIRRQAELFQGERALDLILRGRIAEVAGRYETALAYQG